MWRDIVWAFIFRTIRDKYSQRRQTRLQETACHKNVGRRTRKRVQGQRRLKVDTTDDLEWWEYDQIKYTFLKYPDCYDLPDQFAEEMGRFKEQIAFASKWVPLRIADTDCEGYFINQWMYNTIVGSAEVKWMYLEEPDDDLPF